MKAQAAVIAFTLGLSTAAQAQDVTPVTIDNFAQAESDLYFGNAIKELQIELGDYFAPAQGGARFMSPDVAATLDILDSAGAFGVGQSSWGPTGFAFTQTPDEAARLVTIVAPQARARGLDIRICQALNRGAQIVAQTNPLESAK